VELWNSKTDCDTLIHLRLHKATVHQGRRADLSGAARWCSAVPSAVHAHRWHPVTTKTLVLYHRYRPSLFVPAVRLSTVGRRAFSVTGACIWNDLPSDITSSPSLLTFKQPL